MEVIEKKISQSHSYRQIRIPITCILICYLHEVCWLSESLKGYPANSIFLHQDAHHLSDQKVEKAKKKKKKQKIK